MMLAFHDRESEVNVFDYFLGEKLKKSIAEIEELPYPEYMGWAAYYKVKSVITKMNSDHSSKVAKARAKRG